MKLQVQKVNGDEILKKKKKKSLHPNIIYIIKPHGLLFYKVSLKLVLYMNKVENQLIAIKRENTSTATEER